MAFNPSSTYANLDRLFGAGTRDGTYGDGLDLLWRVTRDQPRNPPSTRVSTSVSSLRTANSRDDRASTALPSEMMSDWFDAMEPPTEDYYRHPRRYRSLDKDPFCTDASFFGSGRFRPTAYCPRDRSQAPHFVPRREPRRGPYTGAARPEGPRVFRKFGDNTRARVMPFRRYTHMDQSGYDDDVVGSERLPSFLNPHAALGQSGSEAVLTAAGLQRTLGPGRPGSKHYLLDG